MYRAIEEETPKRALSRVLMRDMKKRVKCRVSQLVRKGEREIARKEVKE